MSKAKKEFEQYIKERPDWIIWDRTKVEPLIRELEELINGVAIGVKSRTDVIEYLEDQ